ncbi:MAG: hypothetical protein E7B40_11310, partial [Actinomyces sp.]|nr:hypothetical protein [Actinomyces sp.]
HGEIGSAIPGELMAYIIQLDTSLNVVGNLVTYSSEGVQKTGVLSGVATQDGFAYFRVRVTTPEAAIYQSRERFTPGADVFGVKTVTSVNAANRVTTDVTNASTTTYIIGRVMSADGSVVDNAGDSWKAAYLPVKAGEVIQYHGQIGSGTSGQVLAYIIQLDSAMKFVAPLATYTSPGSSSAGVMTGVATQDGFVYVRVRVTDPAATITKTTQLFSLPGNVYAVMNPADIAAANRTTLDVTSAPDTYTITGRVIYSGGMISDTAGENWKAAYVPVRAGDIVRYFGQIGSGTAGEVIAYIIQLDAAMAVVANLATYTSPGVTSNGVMAGVATQDGFVYVRVRVTTPAATITRTSQDKAFASDLRGPVKTIDYTSVASVIADNSVMYSGGNIVSGSAYSVWRMYYIPVRKGDSVEMYGQYGSATVGELIAYIMQCDADKGWVSDLFTFKSGGGYVTATYRGVATQDGYVAVRVRKTTDP